MFFSEISTFKATFTPNFKPVDLFFENDYRETQLIDWASKANKFVSPTAFAIFYTGHKILRRRPKVALSCTATKIKAGVAHSISAR